MFKLEFEIQVTIFSDPSNSDSISHGSLNVRLSSSAFASSNLIPPIPVYSNKLFYPNK
jgi:hypothetical protein